MSEKFAKIFKDKIVAILGFGKEGQSSFNFLKTIIPLNQIIIADKSKEIKNQINPEELRELSFSLGDDYLAGISNADIIIKSPGIPKEILVKHFSFEKITSQADLFLRFYGNQIIGVTGTKGKSTTSSLIQYIFKTAGEKSILVGNIGKPPFDYIQNITEETKIVYELSSHQLDDVHYSPHIGIILNLFEEHLDHYGSFEKYQDAKFNLSKFQQSNDWLILNGDDQILEKKYAKKSNKQIVFSGSSHQSQGAFILDLNKVQLNLEDLTSMYDFSQRKALPGKHNLMNIIAAVLATKIAGIDDEAIIIGVNNFKGLEHRLEYVGKYKKIHFYNDSIATIPEATIEAIKTLKKVDTLILGGMDRGINYQALLDFLPDSKVCNIIFLGEAGKRIYSGLKTENKFKGNMFLINAFNEIKEIVLSNTAPESICLLSPAASSYDMFSNFEERGSVYKKMAENL